MPVYMGMKAMAARTHSVLTRNETVAKVDSPPSNGKAHSSAPHHHHATPAPAETDHTEMSHEFTKCIHHVILHEPHAECQEGASLQETSTSDTQSASAEAPMDVLNDWLQPALEGELERLCNVSVAEPLNATDVAVADDDIMPLSELPRGCPRSDKVCMDHVLDIIFESTEGVVLGDALHRKYSDDAFYARILASLSHFKNFHIHNGLVVLCNSRK
ncbi:uncharacterized protein LAESUDRAFT_761984 [Laetiporus sulphureus 93-53]|uniref:Uncharacterized protein n=1 Tax=Laetiporus sulphureus 93-53 TaxID=1314785 RepID=A0A165CTH9_9APHY|nr:uncharacterized protein LAESUDRAFT_761984 [Laetiporus sulphureus 93-53]KZT03409.1 hypothetical protein LAESUDRAFT_761984 [Laetiporus sulphureus 93-53]